MSNLKIFPTTTARVPKFSRLEQIALDRGVTMDDIAKSIIIQIENKTGRCLSVVTPLLNNETEHKDDASNQLSFSYSTNLAFLTKEGKGVFNEGFTWHQDVKWEYLHNITKQYGYSNARFTNGVRNGDNIVFLGDLLIYDHDDGLTLSEAIRILEPLKVRALIATTFSHQKEKKGVTCDRFRLIFPLAQGIGSGISTEQMLEILQEVDTNLGLGGFFDESCKTIERYYAPNPNQEHWYINGEAIDISTIIDEIVKPKPLPKVRPSAIPTRSYTDSGLSLKEMREYIREHITYETVVGELKSKGLRVSRNGGVYLERKKVGNIHQETRFIRNWAESESMDIIGVLDKFYNEDYVENTLRLYQELT